MKAAITSSPTSASSLQLDGVNEGCGDENRDLAIEVKAVIIRLITFAQPCQVEDNNDGKATVL